MKNLSILKAGNFAISLQPYKAMPKQDKTPKDYSIKVNGADVKHPQVALTGGGTFPAYTYLNLNGEVKWFAGHFDNGSAVEIVEPQSQAATEAVKAQSAAQPEVKAAAKPKKQK